jgi:hypothetical protein
MDHFSVWNADTKTECSGLNYINNVAKITTCTMLIKNCVSLKMCLYSK